MCVETRDNFRPTIFHHRNVSQWEWKIDRNRRANRYIKSLWIDRRIISIGIGSQDGSKFRIGGKYSISKRVDEFRNWRSIKSSRESLYDNPFTLLSEEPWFRGHEPVDSFHDRFEKRDDTTTKTLDPRWKFELRPWNDHQAHRASAAITRKTPLMFHETACSLPTTTPAYRCIDPSKGHRFTPRPLAIG